jgi:glucose dehydrogenase
MKISWAIAAGFLCVFCGTSVHVSLAQEDDGQWPATGGNNHFDRHSSLDLINRSNVKGLKILWTRPAIDPSLNGEFPSLGAAASRGAAYFKSTPIEVEGVVYASDGAGLVEAFDAATGKTIWVQRPFSSAPADLAGASARGVAMWRSGEAKRIIALRGSFLYSLDAKTGKPDASFGDQGRISLIEGGRRGGATGAPLVVGDVIVLGRAGYGPGVEGNGDDGGDQVANYPQVARAYDARTGKKLWEFSPMPAGGDPARATWGDGSAGVAGAMGTYGLISADEELGYVYIPFSAPNPPGFGGKRPGDNLYGNALVAIDVKTGKKIWHYQVDHHDLWDWDLNSPPVLGDLKVGGKTVRAVMVIAKLPVLFTLDRVTGKPVWPIPERPVPPSDVPGEHASPTQPMPTHPANLGRVGFTEDELINFTPDLHKQAEEIAKNYVFGPAYSPPTICHDGPGGKGRLTLPGSDGGGMWSSGSFDPSSNTYYTVIPDISTAWCLQKPERPEATLPYILNEGITQFAVDGPQGLPLIKPPYGRLIAVDMNTGDISWAVPNGEGPRNNPLLKDLHLPMLGNPGKPAVVVTKDLIFVGEGASTMMLAEPQNAWGDKFRAYDKSDGKILAEVTLPAGTSGAPITYSVNGKQFVLVAVSGASGQPTWQAGAPRRKNSQPQWVALGL